MAPTPLGRFLQTQLDLRNELAADFAARSGLGVSHVYQILRGQRSNIRQDTLEKIARGCDMTVAQMMDVIEPSPTSTDPRLIRLHRRWPHLSEELKQAVLRIASTTLGTSDLTHNLSVPAAVA